MNNYSIVPQMPEKLAIFDLDGCVFDDEWRFPQIEISGENRFVQYHSSLEGDETICHGQDRLAHHIRSRHGILFVTARPDNVRASTVRHIQKFFGFQFDMAIFMRGDDEEGIGSVTLKSDIVGTIFGNMRSDQQIIAAYDDRVDIIKMYLDSGIIGARILDKNGLRKYKHGEVIAVPDYERNQSIVQSERNAADILEAAGATFRERNAVYKDNAQNVGNVMAALFPNGVQIKTAADHKMYHLFELIIVKLTRFANSGLTHVDSIHDAEVYAAMCENLAATHNIKFD